LVYTTFTLHKLVDAFGNLFLMKARLKFGVELLQITTCIHISRVYFCLCSTDAQEVSRLATKLCLWHVLKWKL